MTCNSGIKQGAPESAELFGLMMGEIMDDILEGEEWRRIRVPWGDAEVILVFYQDDIFLWEEDAAALSKRIALIADGLGKIGLTLAEDKTMIIASKHYKGPRKALICGKRVDIQDDSMKIRVLGVNFAFGDSPGQQAKDLLSRATSAASFHEDILNEDGKWEDKARMLDALVESTFTWAAAAVQWNKEELSMANSIQIRALRRAFGLRRKSGEEWLDWNTRTWRLVRAWMHTNKVRRWSSHILQLQHGLLGHRARQSEGRNNDGATQHGIAYRMLSWRNHAWWKHQQSLTCGRRHPGCFYPDCTERRVAETTGLN